MAATVVAAGHWVVTIQAVAAVGLQVVQSAATAAAGEGPSGLVDVILVVVG